MKSTFFQEAKEALIAQQDELKEMMASLEKDNEMEITQVMLALLLT